MPVADIVYILVIGGGPAGAYAASALAREGFSVTVLEKDVFPRYHIGESMLPSCRPFLRFIGAEEKVAVHGFTVKVGTAVKLNQFKREGYTDFISPDPTRAAWNVVRSEFDEILLRHSAESGARVCEGVQATGINFSAADPTQPVSADWKSNGRTGTTRFAWLVDASGRAGLLSTKYLKNRKFNRALRNVAMWGYWQGAGTYAPGTPRANAPWFEALTNQTGWAWFIPLHNGTVSIGVVLKEEAHRAKKATLEAEGRATSEAHYCAQLALAPGVLRLLGDAEMTGEVRSAGDYSYSASHYAGPHYRIVGDAGAFIDPFFSSGVHLALANALSAASSIAASIRGHCTEQEAIKFHSEKMGTSYTRFLIVVLSVYRQITAQAAPVLSDIDEDNFDRAFEFLLPVIQGAADTDQGMTEQTLQRTLDFCEHALGPTTPEMHVAVATRLPSESTLLAPDAPPLTPAAVALLAGDDDDVRHVLLRANARRAVEGIYDWEADLCGDVEGKGMDGRGRGLSVVLERGSLGLRRGVVQLS
ncbi:putative halogenase [Mycena belliarum]|uniref:Halogenase n=1 Tax=Mycena belliarum TaxID=1033014 RepID=A0AAD6XTG1_9AGAR|nr:putative halogenase [Mycena belliae]